ncbi:YiiX/YebB-like N1pC/P60 family cysteine hydrolase [Taibaiella chishuiensis]|uniref:Permuted papain-like amidase YaeF/Yiix C92 family enzyme n=1 Tax=Taibaiella chishuiensis TaxID=1434707 RepID=A0A2P8CV57_9BACT|nr:YiiX/YebB-like N1pC/P60 family cysteine hydrolase [Taibaiella chishuiensis]PSK88837.1 permuted papain-like amidase YaeF/Yiix C92 family enzyme [Taibaiella chishuiensis]
MIKQILIGIALLLSASKAPAQQRLPFALQTGDLLFQDLDCGDMCNAIEEVTQGFDGKRFSHVGLVALSGDTVRVIEAMGPGVRIVSLDDFRKRNANKIYIGRVQQQYAALPAEAIVFALKQVGAPYDDDFIYGNGKYYCSELVYDAYKYANKERPFFELQPMTFKQPGKPDYYPVWVSYYKKLGRDIPEGEPGCNPGGLSRSPKIEIVGGF